MPARATPTRLRRRLATTIRRIDPMALDAVLIGSSVYAPELARDYDPVVTTSSPGYEGSMPTGPEDEAFAAWRERVADFVNAVRELTAT